MKPAEEIGNDWPQDAIEFLMPLMRLPGRRPSGSWLPSRQLL
jgi:hypothetical protein